MSKKNLSISALAAILVLSMAAFAVAGTGKGRGFNGPCAGPNGLYSQLTPEKQAEVNGIVEKYAPQFEAVRNQIWIKRSVLQAMINGGNADEKAITKLVNGISEQRTKMRDLHQAMSDDLVKATGLAAFGERPNRGAGFGPCFSQDDDGPARGMGYGQGMMSPGQGMGRGMN